MKTLEEVFKENLKRLRGARTQSEVAKAAKIPLRSYQHAESGIIPQDPNRQAIAGALGVPDETHLFVNLDAFMPRHPITPQEALEVLARAISEPPTSHRSDLSPEARALIEVIGDIQEDKLSFMIEGLEPELRDKVKKTAARLD